MNFRTPARGVYRAGCAGPKPPSSVASRFRQSRCGTVPMNWAWVKRCV
jgi:hypothetical protein